ncbi:MAG: class I SAM-dependent methyltransferase [Candidatus Parabeggiatoa sp. nov. 3]|nr:MAG: class I SAM-dependent methyltransferase [Gammaproteobacteria bacterium]RKZ66731.1 MAG: class I SAM-dependent methyltransferase [Gammaproteobacteria bacterium]RKZ77491.1 MAG: class I SAM-dependent methyltransferase [Gammaproteobacteria bacterium]
MTQWYETLFTDYAKTYDQEAFTQGTVQEVDFIEQEIGDNTSKRILDIGCGTGRHAIELAKRGYQVTGIDLSESQLKRAQQKAKNENVHIDFQQADARHLDFSNEFDLVIILCEGGFSLMETDEMNFAILKNATHALKNEGKLILTTLNALFPLYHSVKDFLNNNLNEGQNENNTFDLMTFREHSTFETVDDYGNQKTLNCNERYYAPSEITWLIKTLGYTKCDIYGCETGNFKRDKALTTEDFEILVIAEK